MPLVFTGSGAKPEETDEPGFVSSFQRGLGQSVQGVGQIAEDLGWGDNPIKRYGEGVIRRNPAGVNSLEDIADNPWLALKEAAGNAASFLAIGGPVGLAGKAAGLGGAARFAAQAGVAGLPSYGGIREQQSYDGNDSAVDMLTAGAGAATVGAIENLLGIQRQPWARKVLGLDELVARKVLANEIRGLGSTAMRSAGKEWLKAAGGEAFEELLQNPIEQMAAYRDPTTGEAIDETLFGGAMGALGGFALGGIGGVQAHSRHRGLQASLSPYMRNPDSMLPVDLMQGLERKDIYDQGAPFMELAEAMNTPVARGETSDDLHRALMEQALRNDLSIPSTTDYGEIPGPTGPSEYQAPPAPSTIVDGKASKPQVVSLATDELISAGIRPTEKRVALVDFAQKLEASGVMTRDQVVDVVNQVADHKNYKSVAAALNALYKESQNAGKDQGQNVVAETQKIPGQLAPQAGVAVGRELSAAKAAVEAQIKPEVKKELPEELAQIDPKDTTQLTRWVVENRPDVAFAADGTFHYAGIADHINELLGRQVKRGSIEFAIKKLKKDVTFGLAKGNETEVAEERSISEAPEELGYQNPLEAGVSMSIGEAKEAGLAPTGGAHKKDGTPSEAKSVELEDVEAVAMEARTKALADGKTDAQAEAEGKKAATSAKRRNTIKQKAVVEAEKADIEETKRKAAELDAMEAAKVRKEPSKEEKLADAKVRWEAVYPDVRWENTKGELDVPDGLGEKQRGQVVRAVDRFGNPNGIDFDPKRLEIEMAKIHHDVTADGYSYSQSVGAGVTGEVDEGLRQMAQTEREDVLDEFGLRDVLAPVMGEVKVSDDPTVDGAILKPRPDGAYDIEISQTETDLSEIQRHVRHEVTHALDGDFAQLFSDDPQMEVVIMGTRVIAKNRDSVVAELLNLARTVPFFKRLLSYPLNNGFMTRETTDALKVQSEIFAQAGSVYLGNGREIIESQAPKTAKYIKEAIEYAKANRGEYQIVKQTNASETGQGAGESGQSARNSESSRASRKIGDGNSEEVAATTLRDVADKLAPATSEAGDFWAKLKPKLLTIHQMVDQYGSKTEAEAETKIKSLGKYVKAIDSMEQFQQQLATGAHEIVINWQKLDKNVRKSLHRVMTDATMWGIHPDKSRESGVDQFKYDDLKSRYNALPTDAKQVYAESRDYMSSLWGQRATVFDDLVTSSYDKLIANDPGSKDTLEKKRDKLIADHTKAVRSIKGPYFPLLRFGDYLSIGKSKEFVALEEQLAASEEGSRKALEDKLAEMKKNQKHYAVFASEYKSRAEAKSAELAAQGMQVKTQLAEHHTNALMPFSANGMDKLRSLFNSQFDGGTANKLDRLLTEVYISSLPEHTALQRQLKRIGVEGAEENMLRAFARSVEQDSFHLSRMKYNDQISKLLFDVGTEAKAAGVQYQHAANNLKQRIDLDFQYQRTPILSMLGRLSSFWHLGVSPAYLFTNSTQPWMVALPNISGRFGMRGTLKEMTRAWTDAKDMIVQSKKDGAFADIQFDTLSSADERKMLQTIRNLGQIDITINFDLGNVAESISPAFLKLQKSLAWANHHIEVSNRITTALTAFRLARQAGWDVDKATEYAYKQVIDTQLDYSNANAAYFMKSQHLGGLNKLVMQFRKYQQGMFYLIAQNAKQAFKGDKQARASLMYLMGMQGAFAGLAGVPFLTMAMFVAGFGIDDDDPDGDAETQFRNFLSDLLGADAARVFYKGLPAMFGMDLSKRIGLGDVWDPTPFYDMSDFRKAKTGKDAVGGALFALAGPAVGTMSNFADAAIMAESGQLGKAAEKMLPKAAADVFRAVRYSDEGLTTRTGSPVFSSDKFSAGDILQRGLGFSPAIETEHYEAQSAKMDTQARIKDRREKLIASWARYKLLGDADDVSTMDKAIKDWNAKHPEKGVRIDRATLLKSVQQRKKGMRQSDEAGVKFTRNEQYLREIDRFAR